MDGKEKTLELETRRKIYNHILKHPGLHERKIARQLKLPLSTLDYHLYYLLKKNIITTRSDGHYKQYFAIGKINAKDKRFLPLVRQKVCRKIIIFLLLENNSNHKAIRNHLNLAASTTSFHLNKLIKRELIEYKQIGRETRFFIKEPEYISELIIRYKKSILSEAYGRFLKYLETPIKENKKDMVDNALDVFFEIFPIPFIS